ncbi:Mrx21p KNAG_0D02300 [Huiozyma naganishii CBS 8797]|uniref:Mitochondrial carrier protein n=1 Tax=Huiozyma naganishii (strain ATCC MYA-139 / BCRC 22969 / CBS 8797 / KCTC 17520 / NBRC 10181 / NCYC 3082 / Yp74L-3) TaxID=1071383 RepID=J7R580_HUIN7|nr:hypothetical protein KNAG_0D02300 [Kazachstania naganishii CBS 8797]CCK69980.1 hypothetical protein KNAG_0D02300 [Kazachstania naganishii CBS 8797]
MDVQLASLVTSTLSLAKTETGVALIAGGMAGTVSRTMVSPFERVKILLQVQNTKPVPNQSVSYNKGVLGSIGQIYKEEGVKGLFRGNGLNCVRIFPYSAVQFVVYEYCKKNMFHIYGQDENGLIKQLTTSQRLFSGSLCAICSLIVTQPLDLIRTRLSIQTANLRNLTLSKARDIQNPPGFWELFKKIYREEGKVFGLYRGMVSSSLQVVPCVALTFTVYEQLKSFNSDHKLSYWQRNVYQFCIGAVSGAVSQTVTYPFDLLRKRFQIMAMGNNEMGYHYTGIWDALKTIGRSEGARGYYKGLTANLFKVIPATAINWLVYELMSDVLRS